MDSQIIKAKNLLIQQAKTGQTIIYREFASSMGICSAPIISQAVTILEKLIKEDLTHNKPLLAAMVVQKKGDIPRPGFFELLAEYGVTDNVLQGADAKSWHKEEIKKIQHWIQLNEN